MLKSSARTCRDLLTLQISGAGRSSRANSIRKLNLESTVGMHTCKMVSQTDTNIEFLGLRRSICNMVPVRSAKYVTTPPSPAPPHFTPPRPAPCLHLTHPVFNPMSPTTHSLNASVARGDTIMKVSDRPWVLLKRSSSDPEPLECLA